MAKDTPAAKKPAAKKPAAKREAQPKLTNSQRRGILELKAAGSRGIKAEGTLRTTLMENLRQKGYASKSGDSYTITDAGRKRSETIDPKLYGPKK